MCAGASGSNGSGEEPKEKRKIKVTVPKWCGKWVMSMDEFADGVVGAKSKNLAGVQDCWSSTARGVLALAWLQAVTIAADRCKPWQSSCRTASTMAFCRCKLRHDVQSNMFCPQACAASCPSQLRCRRRSPCPSAASRR